MYEYSALKCIASHDLNTDVCSTHPPAVPETSVFFRAFILCGQLLYFTPVQLESAFRGIHLAQQETVIAISYSQTTSPQPDESEEHFRHADPFSLPAPSLLALPICCELCVPASVQQEEESSGCIPVLAARAGSHLCTGCV